MKIKLGSTTLNYVEPAATTGRDIVCEVVDSPISFESPVLVSSQDQLDIWFGKDNFPEYDYLSELLRKNVSLLLYKPVRTTENDKVSEGYYFLKDLTPQTEKVAGILCGEDEILENFKFDDYSLPESKKDSPKYYKVISPTGQYYDVENDISYSLYQQQVEETENGDVVQYVIRTTRNDEVSEEYYFLKDLTPQTEKVARILCGKDEISSDFKFDDYYLPESEKDNPKYYKVISPTGQYYDVENDISYSLYQQQVEKKGGDEVVVQYFPCDLDDVKENLSLENRDRISISIDGYYSYYPVPLPFDSDPEDTVDTTVNPPKKITIDQDEIDQIQSGLLSNTKTCHIAISLNSDLSNEQLRCESVSDLYITYNDQSVKKVDAISNYFVVPTVTDSGEVKNRYFVYDPNVVQNYLVINEEGIFVYPSTGDNENDESIVGESNSISGNEASQDIIEQSLVLPGNDDFTDYVLIKPYSKITYFSSILKSGDDISPVESNFDSFIPFRSLCNMPSWFSYENDIEYAQERIYNDYIKDIKEEKRELYRFESKTLGSCSDVDGGDIQVTIEKLGFLEETYRVSITRFSYSEEFIGSMLGGPGIERLDHRISRESRLVRFKILQDSKPKGGWCTGTWTLRGAVVEPTDKCDYSYSLEKMSNLDYQVDFFLFPKKTVSDSLILEATKKMNCQALITNTNSNLDSNMGGGSDDDSENRDPENRLMYFYGNFLFGLDTIRPGYYLFLDNLLSDTSYLPNSGDTLYPVDYGEKDLSKEENTSQLEKYRSNFLTYDGYHYYYDRYFSGENYTTTPLVRFVIGKVTREIEKVKWTLVGSKIGSVEIRDTLERVLENIKNRFSIIRSIVLSNFEVTYRENKVEARITTQLSDLIPSDVSFDIVINYSKKV